MNLFEMSNEFDFDFSSGTSLKNYLFNFLSEKIPYNLK